MGLLGPVSIIMQGLHAKSHAYHTYGPLTLKRARESLGLKYISGARTASLARAPAGECRSSAVSQTVAAFRDDSHTASAMSHPSTIFLLKHLPQMADSCPCVRATKAFVRCDADNMFPRRKAQRCAA